MQAGGGSKKYQIRRLSLRVDTTRNDAPDQDHVLHVGEAGQVTWKSFCVGHATHLAITGESLGQIMAAGEWRSAAFAAYVDPNSLDREVFLNQTMVMSDNEEDDES